MNEMLNKPLVSILATWFWSVSTSPSISSVNALSGFRIRVSSSSSTWLGIAVFSLIRVTSRVFSTLRLCRRFSKSSGYILDTRSSRWAASRSLCSLVINSSTALQNHHNCELKCCRSNSSINLFFIITTKFCTVSWWWTICCDIAFVQINRTKLTSI